MTNPLVTVVMPAYNTETFIRESIRSVLKQTYKPIELIVIDDCSTDLTAWVAEQLPVTFVRNLVNIGECRTSAKGFELASGKYICRLSSDDLYIDMDHIAKQVQVMEQSGADWCYNTDYRMGEWTYSSMMIKSFWLPIPYKYRRDFFQRFDNWILRHPYLALVLILMRNPVNSSSLMMRSSSYGKVRWSETERTDCDGILLMDMLLAKMRGIAIRKNGVFYRTRSGQGSKDTKFLDTLERHRTTYRHLILTGKYPFWMKLLIRLTGGLR